MILQTNNCFVDTCRSDIFFFLRNKKESQAGVWGDKLFPHYAWWPGCIPKSSCLILPHLSLFSLASTMSLVPRRIIGLHSRRQTIYWHFGSLNRTVRLPRAIHFKPYMLGSLSLNQHIYGGINPQDNENNNTRKKTSDQYQSQSKHIHLAAFLNMLCVHFRLTNT